MAPVDMASNPAKTPIHPEVEDRPANPFPNYLSSSNGDASFHDPT
jgi:hypothetical protein